VGMARAPRRTVEQRRVVGYVRISRDRANETSTDSQRAAIEAWCTAHGHQLVKVVVEPGRSAFKASRKSRPGFREVMNVVGTGAADLLAVWKVDRACRNTLDLLTLVQDLEGHGAEFASVTEQFDTSTPMGKAMMTIVGVLAELESAQKSERATEWHHHRRLNAAVPAGPAALGYCKPRPNELVPDPKVAPLVRDAAASIIDGASVLSAVRMLNDAGVKISHRGLTTALQSPTLAGLVAVSDGALPRRGGARVLDDAELVAGGWEPVLDLGTWESVRAVLTDPKRVTTRGNRLKYALAPVARCQCGSGMHVHIERWTKNGGTGEMPRLLCDDTSCATGIGYDAVEQYVTDEVLSALDDDVWNAIRASSRGEAVDTAMMDEKLARMWQMVLDGAIEPEEYAEAKARWMGEQVAAEIDPVELPNVDDVRAGWKDFDAQEKLLVFRATVKSLVITKATRRSGRGVDLSRVKLGIV
jgi:DNA invertase Pin-like site-specific DNA recombinase